MITSIPNLLTISRVVAIPVIVALFYVEGREWQWLACLLFSMAAITDYLDGYFARVWREQSAFGRFLDPVADKLLVAAVILMLVAFGRISGLSVIPALIILCREILVSGLREFLASLQVSLPVSRLAKWKTTIQMVALGFLIVGNSGPVWLPVETIGDIGLWTAAILTLITGWDYLRASARYVTPGAEPPPSGGVPRPAAEGAGQR
ncbi:cardiolipin synthase [Constrictibacter sp. MBR-5]|jgi:cardiolipin synthase|uniref:CDP-diacylglycerol--glycerol-3-phosphate 3-phosphatidyltransferase n=1 Tax=Constrictibacter sp. MBR-5 TaxID=3156467 RepID=UPI00339381EF